MSSSDQQSAASGLQRDALSPESYATITCPSCQGTLRIKADTAAAAPCPICQHPLRYDPPTAAKPEAPAIVSEQKTSPDSPRVVEPTPEAPKSTIRSKISAFNDFLNSGLGILVSWLIVTVLVGACIILFRQWNRERAQRSLRMESIESERPPASRPVERSTVPLLPGEPEPVDPLP